MILVTGATGTVGRQVVDQLVAQGASVRGLTRDAARANLPDVVDVFEGDLGKPETLTSAFDGVRKLFVVLSGLSQVDTLVDIAKQAGVEHVVLLSSSSVIGESDNAISRAHLAAENAIKETGLAWTFVRPGAFMANSLQWAPSIKAERVVRAPFGTFTTVPIHEKDIAAVAVRALLSDDHVGKAYELTGGEALSFIDQVHVIGTVLGEDVRFEELTEEQARERMGRFMPAEVIDALMSLYSSPREQYGKALPTVAEVIGRPPLSYQQWVTEHIAAFR